MTNRKGESIKIDSTNIFEAELRRFREIFPQLVKEGKIDWFELRNYFGDSVNDSPDRYSFTWAGKKQASKILQIPSRGSLVPVVEESVSFENTKNIFIEGDNLEVLKLLYDSYFKVIKMIYIDPPYNTGKDFVYSDNFTDPLDTYLKISGQKDSEGNLLTTNPDTSGRYHSSWLTMMYPRLFIARQLLRDDGVIFVSIDDHEIHNLRMLMNEIFGEENFIATIVWQKKQSPQNDATNISAMHDYVLVYARQAKITKNDEEGWDRQLLPRGEKQDQRYSNPDNDPRGDWTSVDYTCNKTADERPNLYYPLINPFIKKEILPSKQRVWRFERKTHLNNEKENRIWWGDDNKGFPRLKRFRSEVQQGLVPSTWWDRKFAGDNQQSRRELRTIFPDIEDAFDTPKPVQLIRRMLEIASKPHDNDIIMDFFAGSGTTAQAVLEMNHNDGGNRQFIMVQLPEPVIKPLVLKDNHVLNTISDIGRERIKRVINQLRTQTRLDNVDFGFKSFKLSESNFTVWQGVKQPEITEYLTHLEEKIDPLVLGWKETNVIYEVALKEGFKLTCQVEWISEVTTNKIYKVNDNKKEFLICLDNAIKEETLNNLNFNKDTLLVVRDSALTDTLAANLALQCQLKTI
jgi:adenine-specific DNA-methyltransferase